MKTDQGILEYFRILKNNSSLGTSYLFIGEGSKLVNSVLKMLSCQSDMHFCDTCWDCKMINEGKHPDLFITRPEGLITKIERIRESMRFLSLKSFRLKNKIVVIEDGNSLSPQASNAFLKTLEEPPKNSFIAICASKLDGILPTIVSRCRKIFLPASFEQKKPYEIDLAFSFLKGDNPVFKDRSKFSSFLWTLIMLLHEDLLFKATGEDNRLFLEDRLKFLFQHYSPERIQDILREILKIYGVYNNVNINLALNLIRLKLN